MPEFYKVTMSDDGPIVDGKTDRVLVTIRDENGENLTFSDVEYHIKYCPSEPYMKVRSVDVESKLLFMHEWEWITHLDFMDTVYEELGEIEPGFYKIIVQNAPYESHEAIGALKHEDPDHGDSPYAIVTVVPDGPGEPTVIEMQTTERVPARYTRDEWTSMPEVMDAVYKAWGLVR